MKSILKMYQKVENAVRKANSRENDHFFLNRQKHMALKDLLQATGDTELYATWHAAFLEACDAELKARQASGRAIDTLIKRKEEYALAVSPIKCNQVVNLPDAGKGWSRALIVEVHYNDWDKDPLKAFYFNAMPIADDDTLIERRLDFAEIEPERLLEANRDAVAAFYESPVGQEVMELHRTLKQ